MENKDLLQEEVKLEEAMTARGIERIKALTTKHVERGDEFRTRTGKELIERKITQFSLAIDEWKAHASSGKASSKAVAVKLVKDIDSPTLAYLALRQIIAGISTAVPLTQVCLDIGGVIEDEIRLREFREHEGSQYRKMREGAKKRVSDHNKRFYAIRIANEYFEFDEWKKSEKVNIGIKLVELCMASIGIIELTSVRQYNKTIKYITARPEVLEWMKERTDFIGQLRPVYEPMIVKPREWTNPYDGGYLSSNIRPLRLVKRSGREYYNALEKADMPIVYQAVNAMQDTAWQINTFVLDVMLHFWENNLSVGGLPRREGRPIPEKPFDIDTNEVARKAWRRAASEVYNINNANKTKTIQFEILLDIAKRYRNYKKIYQPYQLDFRGRVYAVSPLNCQGSDLTKSLLRFANGKPLGSEGWKWLAVHGAGLIGNDKVSFEDRVNFILDQEEVIRAIVADPYTNRQWAGTIGGFEVDCPWEFLGWCQEWVGFLDHGETFVSKIPVAMDGSCSGLQHYSAMLRDEKVGAAVNLTPADKPSDVYKLVAEEVLKTVQKDFETGTEDSLVLEGGEPVVVEGTKTLAKQWLDFGITRKVTKRAVMTLCYGSKRFGFAEQLKEDFIHKAKVEGKELPFTGTGSKACNYLAGHIWDAVRVSITKASEAMDWLQEISRRAAKAGKPTRFETALGFPVWHEYKKTSTKRIDTTLYGGTRIQLSLIQDTDQLDSRKQGSAIAPNFIHSCDASHMMYTTVIAKLSGITSFSMIHDSFGVPAGDAQSMYHIIRECMVELYSTVNPLRVFKEDMEKLLDEELPEPPMMGELDLNQLKESRYCFS